jgi:outer membrane biosynthesis protein TonB
MAAHAYSSLLRPHRSLLWPFVAASLVGHLLFFVLILGFLERPKPKASFAQKPIRASLVRLGKPRDPTLLPRNEAPPPPPVSKASAPPTPTPPAVSAPSSKATVPAPSKASPPSKAVDASASLASAFASVAKPGAAPLEGQPDGDPMGDSAIQEGERYLGLISAAVKRHYDVSASIPENQRGRLEAFVFIRIASNGRLLESKLTKSSGNLLFDAAVESALKRASSPSFPPPPDHLKEVLRKTGVQLKFNP